MITPSAVSAHMIGQPPFFKINGEFSDLYPVPTSSAPEFELPQDLAKQTHVVGETLEMEMDVAQLPILPEVVDQTTFIWEFGDGAKAEGLKNTHVYQKPGSYIMFIYAKYQQDEPQMIQSTLIQILPDKNYQLPQAKILVNGQGSQDPLTDILSADFGKPVQLDGSQSSAQGGVLEYIWDLGDGRTAKEAKLDYTYEKDSIQVFPVLRVKDANGFFTDTFVQVDSHDIDNPSGDSFWDSFKWPLIGVVTVVLIGLGAIFFLRSQMKK